MSFIELHTQGEPRLINVDHIAEVYPYKLECAVLFTGHVIPSIYDECYDNVEKLISQAVQHASIYSL